MDKTEIQCLESAYLALLRMPYGATRIHSEPLLRGLRDALAVALGREPLQVQEEYGVKALTTAVDVGPVAYQSRFRQFMGGDDSWSGWDNCNEQTYSLNLQTPVRNGWEYQVRALVASPLPQAAQPEQAAKSMAIRDKGEVK